MGPSGGTPAPGNRGRGANGNGRPDDRGNGRRTIFVRPYAGFGVICEFDPETGALQAVPSIDSPPAGNYGDLAGVTVVFYRDALGLGLRVGDRRVDLGADVGVEWGHIDARHTRFAVFVAGVLVCELIYRSLPGDLDLGLLVRDVLADAARRATMYAEL